MVTHALATTTSSQTDITGGQQGPGLYYPLQHYCATRNRAPDKAHRVSERTGTTRPQNLDYQGDPTHGNDGVLGRFCAHCLG